MICRYVALFVPDLRAAEDFYRRVFDMGLLFREAEVENEWRTLPPDRGWVDADAAGVPLGMVALERDGFVLALFSGAPSPGALLEICLGLPAAELDAVHERLPATASVMEREDAFLRFRDPFGVLWQIQPASSRFRSSGEIAGRWLDL